jgi:NRPS condensation-like uncharacterized protein
VRGPSDTLCLKLSHCAADGAGAIEILSLIASIYRCLGRDPEYRVPPNLGSRSRMQLFRHIGWGKCLKICGKVLTSRGFREPRHRSQWRFPSSNPAQRGAVKDCIRSVEPERFDALRAYSKRRKATLNDVLFTAFFRSLCRYLDPRVTTPQTVIVPMDLRRFLPSGKTEAICNMFTQVRRISLARLPDETFEETLGRVSEISRMTPEKFERALFGELIVSIVYRLFHAQARKKIDQAHRKDAEEGRTVAFFTNLGGFDPDRMDFELPVADAHIMLLPAAPPWLFVAAFSFRKRLTLAVSYHSLAVQAEIIENFLDRIIQELNAAVR